MRLAIWLANFVIGAVIFIVSSYFVISLIVTYLKLTGQALEGERMFFDFRTPTWGGLLTVQAICVAILGAGFYLRKKLASARSRHLAEGRPILPSDPEA